MPTIVQKFINSIKIKNYKDQYTYVVVTYDNSAGYSINSLDKLLKTKGIRLNGRFGVAMIDNYVIAYNLKSKELQKKKLSHAKITLENIKELIQKEGNESSYKKGILAPITPVVNILYKNANHIKKFYADDKCTSCGLCEKDCPCNTITIKDGKPAWHGECTFCLKCINTCPKSAIQYGKGTINRERYTFSKDMIS